MDHPDLSAGLLDCAQGIRGAVCDRQVDHVLPVVGAGLEDLPRLDGRVHPQVIKRQPCAGRIRRGGVQAGQGLVPALQEHKGRQCGFTQCRAQVEHGVLGVISRLDKPTSAYRDNPGPIRVGGCAPSRTTPSGSSASRSPW
ncbi:hypothetical protein [Streptomyces massasporeus]|uniref:hypothetical protein n=1 Tax=Streptomyces massasporeus TaxID=67324 RepID=UPI003F4D4E73